MTSIPHPAPSPPASLILPHPLSLIQSGDSKQPNWFVFAERQLPDINPVEDNLTSMHMRT